MADLDFSKVDFDSLGTAGGAIPNDDLVVYVFVIIGVMLVAAYAVKRSHGIELISTHIKLVMKYLSGWALWCFLVFSYDQLFESYLDYSLWFTLPPVSMVLLIVWYRYYFASK